MSTAARIEELRRKFEENPRRYFAPLANELRKAGELAQAIALCREHLPKQPGHMSGYIVFGQALYESESLSEARAVFEQALGLDPENLIALRHLGDIARRQGDPVAARRWYERVLDADPRNDDIAAQLATLSTPAYGSRAVRPTGDQAAIWVGGRESDLTTPVPPRADASTQRTGSTGVPTPGVPMPVVPVAAPDLRPVSFTPSVPVPVIGAVVPTPDAALRAIDFDEVNARLRTPVPTPLSVPAALVSTAPESTPPGRAMPEPMSQGEDLLDLEAMEREGDRIVASSEALATAPTVISTEALATAPTAMPLASLAIPTPVVPLQALVPEEAEAVDQDADPFAFSGDEATTSSGLSESEIEDIDASFEEGLAAPVWPDTADLVARIVTPRAVTPLSVSIPADAAEAFGRESVDPMAFAIPEPEPDVTDAELVNAGTVGTDVALEAVVTPADEAGAAEEDPTETPADIAVVGSNDAARGGPGDDFGEAAEVGSVESSGEASNAPPVDGQADVHVETYVETYVEARVSYVASYLAETDTDGSAEPPWFESSQDSGPETEAIADAIAADARSVGDPDGVSVMALSDSSGAFSLDGDEGVEESSFAEVYPESAADLSDDAQGPVGGYSGEDTDDFAEDYAQDFAEVPQEEPSAAFVTETMGELLVTQGFIERAVRVYEELVRRRPYDPVLSSRLAELQAQVDGPAAAGPDGALVQEQVDGEPAFTEHVFTARERFAALAARRVARRTPRISVAVAAPVSPHEGLAGPLHGGWQEATGEDALSSLFGTASAESQDDLAARALADAFAPPDGTQALVPDSLFDAPHGVADEHPLQGATAYASAPVPPFAPGHEQGTVSAPGSFDRFFPDPAIRSASANAAADQNTPSAEAPKASSGQAATEDLAQFSAWLKGLENT